jgi:hypothetical protein
VGVVEGTWLGLRVGTCQRGRCIEATEDGMSAVEYSIVSVYTMRGCHCESLGFLEAVLATDHPEGKEYLLELRCPL